MITTYEDIGKSPWSYLSYSDDAGYSYTANLDECPDDLLDDIIDIDKSLAVDAKHCVSNWKDLYIRAASL